MEKEKSKLREKWYEVTKETFALNENDTKCPTCLRELEDEDREKKIADLRNTFETEKTKKLEEITEKGKKIGKNQEDYEEKWLKESKDKVETYEKQIIDIKDKQEKLETEEKNVTETKAIDSIEYQNLLKEVKELESQVKDITEDAVDEELKERKKELREKVEQINQMFNKKDTIEKAKKMIEEYEAEQLEVNKKVQECDKINYLCEKFSQVKVDMLEDSINKPFDKIKFKLLVENINGGIKETCEPTLNGVPYSDLNNAHKVIAGLDIIKAFMERYNISAPIFIDNRESINEIIPIDAQVINLVVTTDKELRCEII